MKAETLLNAVRKMVGIEVKLGSMLLADGATKISFDGEMIIRDAPVYIEKDGEQIPLPAGEYELETGMMIVVDENGIVTDIKYPEKEESGPAAEVEPVAAEAEKPKKVVESTSKEMFFSEEAAKSLIERVTKLEAKLEAVEAEKEKLSAEEKAEPIKHNPEGASETKEIFKYAAQRTKGIQDKVFEKLFKN